MGEIRGEDCPWGRYREFQQQGLKHFVESALREALSWRLGAGWYERGEGRRGYRNGSCLRTLVTPFGTIDVEVPRLREGTYEHGLWDAHGLLTADARELILETYLSELSFGSIDSACRNGPGGVLGYEVSASTVSAICRGLDDLVRQYWRSPISDDWEYLLLDAVVVKNRSAAGAEGRCVLVAMGIRDQVPGGKQFTPLAQVTIDQKGSSKALIDTGFLVNAITQKIMSDGTFVGLLSTSIRKDGESVANIGAIMEYGAAIVIPPRPFLHPTMERYRDEVIKNYREALASVLK